MGFISIAKLLLLKTQAKGSKRVSTYPPQGRQTGGPGAKEERQLRFMFSDMPRVVKQAASGQRRYDR